MAANQRIVMYFKEKKLLKQLGTGKIHSQYFDKYSEFSCKDVKHYISQK